MSTTDICIIGPFDAGFRIQSKLTAKQFLEKIPVDRTVVAPDLKDLAYHYIIHRYKDQPFASIAHERKVKDWFDPDLMRCGEGAINMAYEARRSINIKMGFIDLERRGNY